MLYHREEEGGKLIATQLYPARLCFSRFIRSRSAAPDDSTLSASEQGSARSPLHWTRHDGVRLGTRALN